MAEKTSPPNKNASKHPGQKAGWVLGAERFSKISAVEGLVLTKAMTNRKEHFERAGMSAKERREAIIKVYKR